MLKRTAIKKSRSKPRAGRVKGKAMTALREKSWNEHDSICRFCNLPVSEEEGHLAHIKGKRNHGDVPENVTPAHWKCHLDSHSGTVNGKFQHEKVRPHA
jgi:hypothetical protein